MTFQPGPSLPSRRGRWISQAVHIDARLCLLIGRGGGEPSDTTENNFTELLDLETMEFTGGPAMMCGDRSGPAAIGLSDGRILVIGGGEHGDLRTELLDNNNDDGLLTAQQQQQQQQQQGRRRSASGSSSKMSSPREKKIQKGGFFTPRSPPSPSPSKSKPYLHSSHADAAASSDDDEEEEKEKGNNASFTTQ
jgi:hypothetical protein